MNQFNKIYDLLATDFERNLFEASLTNLRAVDNNIRYNNFAYSIRELSRHFLQRLAPDNKVKECSWYKKESEDDRPTRSQRIKYAIQGGIPDLYLENWGFDIDKLNSSVRIVKDTIVSLNRYTHINEDSFALNNEDIEKMSNEVLSEFKNFVETIEYYRTELKRFLDKYIENHIVESTVSNFFENLDALAPRFSIERCDVDEYHITDINEYEITVEVRGNISVTLEYGSRKERTEGDGLDVWDRFPFETKIRYQIAEEFPPKDYSIDEYDVDTSSWYQEYDDQ